MYPILKVTAETTHKQVFLAVVRHLLDQGKRSQEDGESMYRGGEAFSLADPVGCLLTDDEMGLIGYDLPERLERFRELLWGLSLIHDHVDPKDWAARFQKAERELLYRQAYP
jgi:hypothetical protein